MAAPASVSADAPVTPRWGLGDAAAGWVLAFVGGSILGGLIIAAFGYAGKTQAELPIWLLALSFPPLWLGFVGTPVWAAQRKGNGWIRDFKVRFRPVDVPVGIAAGIAAQFVGGLLSVPVLVWRHKTAHDLSKPARDLANNAHGAPAIVLFAVVVAVGAPLAEELFFRGLLLRALEKSFAGSAVDTVQRYGVGLSVAITAVVFALTHFEALQFVGLLVAGATFSLLAVKADRLGPAVFAHMAFNGTAVVQLLAAR